MCKTLLKTILQFALLGFFLSLYYTRSLPAEETQADLKQIKSNLWQTSLQLEEQNKTLLLDLGRSRQNITLLNQQLGQYQTELQGLQTQLQTALTSLSNLKTSSDNFQKDVSTEISSLKWAKYEWAIGGLVVGFSIGLLVFALVK